ncbi:hypothetical protein [Halorussus salinisoli]|uniref:hypothetical protein n=1 Tax=Halorussus salinisoli TaxID=2558242 RepID=UPI0010C15AA0|nr:hypothetical protein [Halorussus salinisoli]
MFPLSRRTLLRGGTPLLGASLAGCLASNPFGCDSMDSAVVRTKRVTLSAREREAIDPIVFDELPDSEREIARAAVEDGEYRKCPAADPYVPDPLTSFAERAAAHEGENGHGPAYLKYDDAYYAVGVSIEDQSYAAFPN